MSIVKPFTFVAGTKAKAGEVNDNFDVLYTQVNANISELAQINIDIDNIGLNKANINGNSTQRFSVADAVNNTDAVNKQYMLEHSLPTGLILYLAVEDIPDGYLLCDGSTVSRSTYSNLYAVLGTKYGAGDGTTTFTIPDLIGKFPEGGSTAGTYKNAGLPNIWGGISWHSWHSAATGVFDFDGNVDSSKKQGTQNDSSAQVCGASFDASRCSAIYGASNTVQPNSLVLLPLIKY